MTHADPHFGPYGECGCECDECLINGTCVCGECCHTEEFDFDEWGD